MTYGVIYNNRQPGTLVPEGLMFYCRCFLIFSPRDLRAPSADRRETLPRDRNLGVFYNASPKIRGPSPKKWSPKTCKIRRDFRQLQTSIANISGTGKISKIGKTWITSDSSRVYEKVRWTLVHYLQRTVCEFGPTQIEFFGRLYFGPYGCQKSKLKKNVCSTSYKVCFVEFADTANYGVSPCTSSYRSLQ